MFHADMFMGKGFDKNLIKHLKPNLVISGTRIEPPLHPVAKEKIINGASKSATRCVEIASGSPLTEEELNGTPNRECPSFWPTP